ncbi:chemotaxis protein CheA [Paraburkholderia sp. DHOC27]|uniref:chemotaxis protein CheA n=1 Tax=Paraburkholderia sp. DHOC27 TaxID=2303330 RepID=UPI000E3E727B|nr:chemotaxis protein CheA [Paraburkholderia sp. DHOC27]RFU44503.1 chemotaxis protein CheA [Paraburkholderia sp. DHOC27]
MNEFLEQFLIECREQVEQATADLLALEKSPSNIERLDSAFRAFHTLKGGAGIVDFDAMADALHGAEDGLSYARNGTIAISTTFIGDCLACLDQVERWADEIAKYGDLPKNASKEAAAIVARFSHGDAAGPGTDQQPEAEPSVGWLATILAEHPDAAREARCALQYTPDADCFFSHEDPLARIEGVPGLLAVEISPLRPWTQLCDVDPFQCNLVLTALSSASEIDIRKALADVLDRCHIEVLGGTAGKAAPSLLIDARALLEAQLALLESTVGEDLAGKVASAGAVVINVLRAQGNDGQTVSIEKAMAQSLAEGKTTRLTDAIKATLFEEVAKPVALAPFGTETETAARSLRIDSRRVDSLVDLTAELTIAKNAIGHIVALAQNGEEGLVPLLKQRFAVLDRLIGDLQQGVRGLRVLPLRHVFQRFPRLLREIAAGLDKSVDLVTEGAETEADKAIVEMLFEPLLHVVRNAVDHGIEDKAGRLKQGKSAVAKVGLRGYREGENVLVEITDDGQGINVERVRQVALQRGVVTAEALATMSEAQVTALIFEPGFSTAQSVTELSGRGVGMDVVRTKVARMGGTVGIESTPGAGTAVRFTLPFSVMLTRIMVVSAAGQKFGIPLDAVVETLRVGRDAIAPVGAAQAIVLRNQTVPVIDLREALNLHGEGDRPGDAILVVANVDGVPSALRVDAIGERFNTMLKPLEGLLSGTPGLAGSTLLGDGSVLLILDLTELCR